MTDEELHGRIDELVAEEHRLERAHVGHRLSDSEKQRMDVLATKDGVVLVIVDSLDGTTYDSLVKKADTILSTVTFDKS